MHRATRLPWAAAPAVCAWICASGCIPEAIDSDPSASTPPEEVASGSPVDAHNEIEPNNEYAAAEVLFITSEVTLTGEIGPANGDVTDRDMYELGPVAAGDRVRGTLNVDSNLDVVMGLLDEDGRLLAFVNPRSSTSGPGEIDIVIHEDTNRLYVMLSTRTAFSSSQPYEARITIERGSGMGPFHPQVVVLDFEGGDAVQIGNRSPVNVPRFDAATIGLSFAGQTEEMIDLIVEKVRADYTGLNVDIYRSGDPGIPGGDYSIVYFGTYDASLLGLADNIDPFNEDPVQAAILYTDTFSLFTALNPSVEEMAQVLANVASHEVGHLVGLRHTSDPAGIMDVTASARQMMQDQFFTTSPLYERVLPVGVQDAPSMLSWTLGGSLPARNVIDKALARERVLSVAGTEDDFHLPMRLLGSGCDMEDGHHH